MHLFVSIQNQRIRGLLEKCTFDHEARVEALHNELSERALSDARWSQIQQELSQSVSAVDGKHLSLSLLDNVCKLVVQNVFFYFLIFFL